MTVISKSRAKTAAKLVLVAGYACMLGYLFNEAAKLNAGQRRFDEIESFEKNTVQAVQSQGFTVDSTRSEAFFTSPEFHQDDHATMGMNITAVRNDSTFEIQAWRLPAANGTRDTILPAKPL